MCTFLARYCNEQITDEILFMQNVLKICYKINRAKMLRLSLV